MINAVINYKSTQDAVREGESDRHSVRDGSLGELIAT